VIGIPFDLTAQLLLLHRGEPFYTRLSLRTAHCSALIEMN